MPKSDTKQKKGRKNRNRLRIKRTKVFGPKGIDQVKSQVESRKRVEYDPELPGGGQFYCYECDRHFISEDVLIGHRKSSLHRKRIKEVREPAHSQKDAEWAVGLT
ncbi:U1-like Zn-finger-containing protein [Encephalitozoon romaleae SJ-2008]|uniref:U1-like Zn-finger-containing protein n=1 Tax=Encephalitozoon romaleae (strain SJ-2008) TaxID=1178016 RepID=I7AQA6_ENCRO|nr:U1-like Zn-finger-containing protein [Encephalitozoon romaleae SJ-2008]AFN82497.1 U1-like Zn-finger-containing protein [Encephalitozoon romaleae SJ-2008]